MEEEPGCRKEALGEAVCVRVHVCMRACVSGSQTM